MQIHILRGEESTGPYTPDQVRDYYNQGTLLPTDFAYHDGLAGWVPLEQLLAELPPIVEAPALAQLPQGIVHKEPEASSSVHAVTPPKAKKKIQLMVAVVVGLLVLGGLAFGGWKLFKGTEPIQTAQNQIPPKAEQKVNSEQPLSPNPAEAPPITSTPVGTNTVVETPEPPSGEGSGGKTKPSEERDFWPFNPKIEEVVRKVVRKPSGKLTKIDYAKVDGLEFSRNDKLTNINGVGNLTNMEWFQCDYQKLTNVMELRHVPNLTELDISNNRLIDLRGLENMTNLKKLKAEGNRLIDVKALKNLNKMEELELVVNRLVSVSGLENMTNLTELDLRRNRLTDVNALKNITKLKALDLSYNRLASVSGLENMTNLTKLNLRHNNLTNISMLGKLKNLTYLNLEFNPVTINQISSLQEILPKCKILDRAALPEIESETLIDKKIRQFVKKPDEKLTLEDYSKVKGLRFEGEERISSLKGLEKLANLEQLHLEGGGLHEKNALGVIENLINIEFLTINHCFLTDVKGLEKFTNMHDLRLDSNRLTNVSELGNMTKLKILQLSRNYLSEVKGLEKLAGLESLGLGDNQINDVSGLAGMANLTHLVLGGNQLTDVKELEKLKNLKELNLQENQLTEIEGLKNLKNLEKLDLRDNADLTKQQIAELQKALPDCKISHNAKE
jgi:internalin A